MDDPGRGFLLELADEQLDALLESLVLVAMADGEMSAVERRELSTAVDAITEGQLQPERFAQVVQQALTALERDGVEVRVQSLAARLPDSELREVALVLASDVAASDGYVHPAERGLLKQMAVAFELDASRTDEVLDGLLPDQATQ
jgi:tellurite resistance protein